jgi:hypothetical protein
VVDVASGEMQLDGREMANGGMREVQSTGDKHLVDSESPCRIVPVFTSRV